LFYNSWFLYSFLLLPHISILYLSAKHRRDV
jgi:hypothetical protein